LVYLFHIFQNATNKEFRKILNFILEKSGANTVWIPRTVIDEFKAISKGKKKRDMFMEKMRIILEKTGLELKKYPVHNESRVKELMLEPNLDAGEADAHSQGESLLSSGFMGGVLEVAFLTNDKAYIQWAWEHSSSLKILDWQEVCQTLQLNLGCRKQMN